MNERINQLLGQAYDEAVPETWTTLSSEQLGRIHEKFAKLIVRECLTVINQPNGVGDDDVIRISEDVKKHFGVRE